MKKLFQLTIQIRYTSVTLKNQMEMIERQKESDNGNIPFPKEKPWEGGREEEEEEEK